MSRRHPETFTQAIVHAELILRAYNKDIEEFPSTWDEAGNLILSLNSSLEKVCVQKPPVVTQML